MNSTHKSMLHIHSLLPLDWDLLNIGHCYAVSAAGALKFIKLFAELYLPLDLQLISKIEEGVLKSYSVNPASIIQINDNPSDVSPGADFLE
ncbi:25313_t:CDS:2 [Gigaspora margarita]|uniref:25313_t:CDS:1 n=1 Tax=Gigaspora margarita TaxID=4874 RepID=A0ABN7VC52_GIGMA|nr:25313_t:CDS:2 [Gigaspora margarita]